MRVEVRGCGVLQCIGFEAVVGSRNLGYELQVLGVVLVWFRVLQ